MPKNTITGYPRIGEKRELKFAMEDYWSQKISFEKLEDISMNLRKKHWKYQKSVGLDLISINDISYSDVMLDTSLMLGIAPKRFQDLEQKDQYFAMLRGTENIAAMESKKWFNTNQHYLVPELSTEDIYELDASKIIAQYEEAKKLGLNVKINLLGPLTYVALSKKVDGGDNFELFNKIVSIYEQLLEVLAKLDESIYIQIEEPILVSNENLKVLSLIKPTYEAFCSISKNLKIMVSTYFGHSNKATKLLVNTPIYGLGLDFVSGYENFDALEDIATSSKKLIVGVVDGKNIWKNDFEETLKLLEKISQIVPKDNLIVSSSCSLPHVPSSLEAEVDEGTKNKSWLSYANDKIVEVNILSNIFFDIDVSHKEVILIQESLQENKEVSLARKVLMTI